MATHSRTLAWRIPWTEEPGRLQSIVKKSRTWLKQHNKSIATIWEDFYNLICNAVEKEMATHSRTLAWRIPWAEEPGRLQSMGS